MEAVRRRFFLTGKLPRDGATVTTFSKVSAAELARLPAEGGFGLPTIAQWIAQLNCRSVICLVGCGE
eukprot:SAG22_NODE_1477_length_4328_cov_2.451643_8_plen_67_part_00